MPVGLKIIMVLVAIGALFAGKNAYDKSHYDAGWNARAAIAQADELRIAGDASRKLAGAVLKAAADERALRDKLAINDAQRLKGNADYEKRIAALDARIRAGAVRLSVALNPDSIPGCAAGKNTGTGAGSGAETRADLMPGVTERIFSIAGRSARDMRDYNALVDAYNAARATCNAQ